jgi:hypothetical protein
MKNFWRQKKVNAAKKNSEPMRNFLHHRESAIVSAV